MVHTVDRFEQMEGVEKVVLSLLSSYKSHPDLQAALAVNRGVLADCAAAEGIKVYCLPQKSMSHLPGYGLRWLSIVKEFQPDIVHSHHRFTTFIAQLSPGRRYKVLHTFHVEQFSKAYLRFFGDRATAVSEGVKRHFVKRFGVNPEKATVVYNGIKTSPAGMRDASKPPLEVGGKVCISVIGRLEKQKGHAIFIQALMLLQPETRKKLKVYFVGEGSLRRELEQAVKDNALENTIHFTGYQTSVSPFLNESLFTVLPSLWEGFGLTIVESNLAGKPVIASRVGGIPEVIQHGKTGILVEPGDPQALSSALADWIQNQDQLPVLGRAARLFAEERFTVDKMIDGYRSVYASMVERGEK